MRAIIFVLLLSLISFCQLIKHRATVALNIIVQIDTLNGKSKPIIFHTTTVDTIYLTKKQAKKLKNRALKQYQYVKSITDNSLKNIKTFHHNLNSEEFNYLKNIIANKKLYIADSFVTNILNLPDSFLQKYSDNFFLFENPEFYKSHTEIQFFPILGNAQSLELYAIALGSLGLPENYVLFFKRNKLIGYKKIFHRYGMENDFFRTIVIGNDTIICFIESFASGTGIGWFEYLFYLIKNDSIKPIQTIIEEGNLSLPGLGATRYLSLELISCKPLKFRAYYTFSIYYSHNYQKIFDETVTLKYRWNFRRKKFTPVNNRLDTLQLYSFSPSADYDLFIYAFRKKLISLLHKKEYSDWILWFLQ